ncbi:Zn-dependent exopeptidase [Annulohypoxylon maeteangense]|uniref:Zn-dependent exopeptidase n=1 Tax=Annulohypoxylon maeteangense TaxID=1927788 RepID=UPI00200724A5|nr:Zn-dependent exopeptidase [Annulohypoxylon maeteangense]KAI0888775.1 Zn-dependent exopeptidase [Annulohypoxylon maeteangense]
MRALSQQDAERLIIEIPEVDRLRSCSKLYSAKPHLAGDLQHAERIRDLWRSYGIPTELVRYDVLQNFPIRSALHLHCEDGSIAFDASLIEDDVAEDPTSAPQNGLPSFFGFGAHGTVSAKLVYTNFGTLSDFQLLESKGISVKGKIVICKYSKVFRGLKVRAAEQFGAVGVIIYSDPQEDGEYTVKNGYKPYPHGPARHPKSIQRGSVDFFSVSVGDPTTPGYPSLPGDDTERRDPKHAIPSIPAIPISFSDAIPFLEALNGRGLGPDEFDEGGSNWKGALDSVDYCTGPSKVNVTLCAEGDYRYSPIYNVIGTIEGQTDETVILGNHHDSWCCGAVDPVSGNAAMNEAARGLARLVERSWKPYRKIILASWDNEEYGLVGSTEFGEQHAEWLTENCVAYINVDEATNGGNILGAYGSPLLSQVLREAANVIPSPVNEGKTVYDDWLRLQQEISGPLNQPNLTVMGTGSDYTVFFHHLGISSLDMLFNQKGTAVYPYHSNYDSYYWIDKFGDPGFKKHLAMARLWGLLIVKLAGTPILPFRASDYADALKRHVKSLSDKGISGLILEPLERSISRFETATNTFDSSVHRAELGTSRQRVPRAEEVSKVYMKLERSFLLEKGGLPGRPWYKHLIFAPGLWAGYDGVVFPCITECLENGDVPGANIAIQEVSEVINQACSIVNKRCPAVR